MQTIDSKEIGDNYIDASPAPSSYWCYDFSQRFIADTFNLMSNLTATPNMTLGCFDESGKWTDSNGVFVFAGIVTFPPVLHVLSNKWVDCLNASELSYISMKEAVHFQGPWLKYKAAPRERDRILCEMCSLFASMDGILRVVSRMSTATNKAFVSLTAQQQAMFLGNPYYGSFEACVVGALQARVDTVLHITCDISEEYAQKCIVALHKMMKARDDVKRRCLGISFANDRNHTGLQIADMLAYCERAQALKELGGEFVDPVIGKLLEILRTDDVQELSLIYRTAGSLGGVGHAAIK